VSVAISDPGASFEGPSRDPAPPNPHPNTVSTPSVRSYPPPVPPLGHLPTPANDPPRCLSQPSQPRLLASLPSIASQPANPLPVPLQPVQNRQLQIELSKNLEPGSFPFQPAQKLPLQVEIPQTPGGDFFASPDSVLVAQQLSLGSWEGRPFERASNQWAPSPGPPLAPTPPKRVFTTPPPDSILGTAPAWLGGHAADDFLHFGNAVRRRSQEPQIEDAFWGAQTSSHMGRGGQAKGRNLRKIASESELTSIPHPPKRKRSVSLGRRPEVSFQKPLQAEDGKGDLQAEASRGLVATFFPGPKRAEPPNLLRVSTNLGGLPQAAFLRGSHSHPFPNTNPLPSSTLSGGLVQGGPTARAGLEAEADEA
jgi:hypothetical protein